MSDLPPPGSLRATFRQDGLVVLRSYLTDSALRELASGIEAARAVDLEQNPLSRPGMQFVSNAYRRSRRVQRFATSDAVVALLRAIGLESAWLRWDQAVWKYAGAPRFPWHQDNGYTGIPHEHVQVWTALTAMGPSNGGLEVAPGTHHETAPHAWSDGHAVMDPPDHVRTIVAEPSDVIVFSSRLPHSTTSNRHGPVRLAYVAEYLPMGVDDATVNEPHLVVMESSQGDDVEPSRDLR